MGPLRREGLIRSALDRSAWRRVIPSPRGKDIEAVAYDSRGRRETKDINVLYWDSRERLWIGTDGGLLCRDHGEITYYETNSGLPRFVISCLAEDGDGNIWVGQPHSPPYRLENGHFVRVEGSNALAEGIVALLKTRDGSLWMSTHSGRLARLQNGKTFLYTEEHGLGTDHGAFAIVEDDAGDLWLSTGVGVLRISRGSLDRVAAGTQTTLDCLLLDKCDGMRSPVCHDGYQPSSFKDLNGLLWFATIHGMVMVDPSKVAVRAAPIPTYIEKVETGGKNAGPLAPKPGAPSEFVVPAGTRRLFIGYAGIDLGESGDVKYQYRQKDDKDWVFADSERVARLYDLRPGEYTFTVRAQNKEGTWSPAQASMSYTVLPFFWQTIWFRIAAGLALLGTVSAAVARLQVSRHRRLEQERALVQARAHSAALLKANSATESALRRFEAVIGNTPFIAIQGCDRGGRITHWNIASEALFGLSSAHAIGRPIHDLFAGGPNAKDFKALLERLWGTGDASEPREWTLRLPNRPERSLFLSVFPLRQDGKTVEVFCMEVDITERKELEERLRQAVKMEAVGHLAGGIAHDFNNILTVIQGHVGLLLSATASPQERESLREVASAAERAANLTRQLLTFSRRRVLQSVPFDLNETIGNLSKCFAAC